MIETVTQVQTVTGPIDASELGLTLVHEHALLDMYEVTLNSVGVLADEDMATDELQLFRNLGGRTIVEQTTVGLNPDIEGLQRISKRTGVTIVAGTGIYWRRFRPAWVETVAEEDLSARFICDLTQGVGRTGIRAGLIGEIATGHRDIDDVEARVFRAAAAAQRSTGVPIATHAVFSTIGLNQLDILERAGADLTRVVIGHADTNPRLAYHLDILRRGAWLAFDTVGQMDKASDDWRAERLVELAHRGFLRRLLVSSDVCKRPALARFGGLGYGHVITDFVPRLVARGFNQDDIAVLTIGNPRRLFE